MAAGGDSLIVVTDNVNVFLVDVKTGEIKWTVADIDDPSAVTFEQNGLIMVADSKNKVIVLATDLLTNIGDTHLCWFVVRPSQEK